MKHRRLRRGVSQAEHYFQSSGRAESAGDRALVTAAATRCHNNFQHSTKFYILTYEFGEISAAMSPYYNWCDFKFPPNMSTRAELGRGTSREWDDPTFNLASIGPVRRTDRAAVRIKICPIKQRRSLHRALVVSFPPSRNIAANPAF